VLQPPPPEPAPLAATAAPLAAAAPSVPTPAVDTQERVVAPAPPAPVWDANLAAARDWVRRMPRGVWLVQHASLDERDAAKTWLQQHPQLRRARVVAALKGNGQRHYVVVSGPFNGFDRAKAYAAGPGMPSEPWLRGAASLKTVLADEKD
jgi:septal ring-binding cell division protein DamX